MTHRNSSIWTAMGSFTFVSALISKTGVSREVLRRCLNGGYRPFLSLGRLKIHDRFYAR